MAKGEMVLLATTYNRQRFNIAGAYVSEKLDGVRAIWLPETRGWKAKDVPFFNRARDTGDYTCSGFWSRLGKPFRVPESFCETMPKYPLDGELFLGRGKFEDCVSVVRKHDPVLSEWSSITYMVFDRPSYEEFYRFRDITTPHYNYMFSPHDHEKFKVSVTPWWKKVRFSENIQWLRQQQQNWPGHLRVLEQTKLPVNYNAAEKQLDEVFNSVIDVGGEGVMLRLPNSIWEPVRAKDLVKLKPEHDIEGNICAYKMGFGKLDGLIGAFRVRLDNGKEVDVSGFTDAERAPFFAPGVSVPGPGETTTTSISILFPINTRITIKYNELTGDGIPRFPRYFRKRANV